MAEPARRGGGALCRAGANNCRAPGKPQKAVERPYAPIEKLLVELCFEARDLQFIALPEFRTMLAGTQRIQMATLIAYAADRKLALKKLFGKRNQLIPPF